MPSNRVDNKQQSAIVTAGASPVTVTIPPHSNPITLVITSASAITVTGSTGPGHEADIIHNP
jgi:hypothetical protein